MGMPGHEFLKSQHCCTCGWKPEFRGPIHPEQQWSDHLRSFEPQPSRSSDNAGLIGHLAREIWTRWHGPLARIPGTHEEAVTSLGEMFDDYDD